MKKKLFLYAASLGAVALPTITVVACNDGSNEKDEPTNKENKSIIKSNAKTSISKGSNKKEEPTNKENKNIIKSNAEISISKILEEVKEDGMYILKDDYAGTLYEPQKLFTHKDKKAGVEGKKSFVRIPKTSGYSKPVIELAKNDSIYVLYDKDDTDGFSQSNFTDTVTFYDSSMMWMKDIKEINLKIGSIKLMKGTWDEYDLKFENPDSSGKGKLSKYIGSQSNHTDMTFDEALEKVKKVVSPSQYEKIKKYYEQGTSKAFVPVVETNTDFVYEKIGKRAIKITFVGTKPITAAKFRMSLKNNNKGTQYGIYSLTKKDHPKYESKTQYSFLARYKSKKELEIKNKKKAIIEK